MDPAGTDPSLPTYARQTCTWSWADGLWWHGVAVTPSRAPRVQGLEWGWEGGGQETSCSFSWSPRWWALGLCTPSEAKAWEARLLGCGGVARHHGCTCPGASAGSR